MENTVYTKENHELSIMDLVNLSVVVVISLRNTIIFFILSFLLFGFLSTSKIEPLYSSKARLSVTPAKIIKMASAP